MDLLIRHGATGSLEPILKPQHITVSTEPADIAGITKTTILKITNIPDHTDPADVCTKLDGTTTMFYTSLGIYTLDYSQLAYGRILHPTLADCLDKIMQAGNMTKQTALEKLAEILMIDPDTAAKAAADKIQPTHDQHNAIRKYIIWLCKNAA